MTTQRARKVGEHVVEILARVLRKDVRDPRIGFVTLTGAEVSPDLRLARVFFSVLGGAAERAAAGRALNHAAPFLRRRVAREAGLRYAPEIRFEEDASLESGSRVDALLREISADAAPGGASDEPAPGGDREAGE